MSPQVFRLERNSQKASVSYHIHGEDALPHSALGVHLGDFVLDLDKDSTAQQIRDAVVADHDARYPQLLADWKLLNTVALLLPHPLDLE